jgi:plastocyanin
MRRGGSVLLLAALAMMGLAVGIVVPGGRASSQASRVTVTATDVKFTLSKRSAPTGTVIFAVTNKGKISHNFKIAGKKTPLLASGHSATLRVTFLKKGRYPYSSTVSGQASAGMKGVFSVVARTPAPTTTTTETVGTANTTVAVEAAEDPPRFTLSRTTMPSGMVTFVITSKCVGGCSFHLEGIKAGAVLYSGQWDSWTVALPPGSYRVHCDVFPPMSGTFIVTS